MQEMLTDSSSTMQLLMDTIITHRFDLAMFAIGLAGYIVLCSVRREREAKGFHKKLNITFDEVSEVSEVIDAKQGTDAASELSEMLEVMEHCGDDVNYPTEMLEDFLKSHPTHDLTPREVEAMLAFCSRSQTDMLGGATQAKALGDALLEHMQAFFSMEEEPILTSFIRFFIDTKQSEKACNLFELNYATFFDSELDEQLAWQLLMAALKCGRQSLAEHLLQTSESDIGRHVDVIQSWWRRKAAKMGESRVAHMGEVLNRLSNVFNERFPFEDEHSDSDGESTTFLGDDSDREVDHDSDVGWDDASHHGGDRCSDIDLDEDDQQL